MAHTRRGVSSSPWFGQGRQGRRLQPSASALLPTSSWWIAAVEQGRFYDAAREQLPRLIESGGALIARGPMEPAA
jgi:hypothetical protein